MTTQAPSDTTPKYLTRAQIFAVQDVVTEEVPVPEWGGTVLVRSMTGEDRDEFEAGLYLRQGKRMVQNIANIRARLVSKCVIGDDGYLVFSEPDIERLGKKSAAALDRVYSVASRLSGFSDEDIEEMVKDFDETAGDDSSSS